MTIFYNLNIKIKIFICIAFIDIGYMRWRLFKEAHFNFKFIKQVHF